MKAIDSPEIILGVVGAGAMGAGIAQVSAAAGIRTRIHDARPGAAVETCEKIRARFGKRATAGKMSAEDAYTAGSRLLPVTSLGELADCDVVIEAIVEKLEVKSALLEELEGVVREDTILASNTSSLPIGAIASGLKRPERVAGMHFFNPVPVMKLVEVIRAPDTSVAVIDVLIELGRRLGRVPVVVKDTPGFLVNFGGRAYTTEGLAIVHEGVATPSQVDAIMRDSFGFRMGPFELMDLTGMDVNFPVTRFIHESFFGDPRLRSAPLHRYMLDTGQLGRKTGRGFYDHSEGVAAPSPDTEVSAVPTEAVFVHGEASRLSALIEACGAQVLAKDDGRSPILAAPVGEDASAYAVGNGLDHRRLVCVDTVSDCERRVTLMAAPNHDVELVATVVARFAQARRVSLIGDSPGFVGQRIASMVANLGCEMAQMGLAKIEDIDLALRLGLNYPYGPLELADHLGSAVTYRILKQAQLLSGDDRYRPSQWLRRRAQLGLSARAD